MRWAEVRQAYPDQWLIVEALEAETTSDNQRLLNRIAVVEQCEDGSNALQSYRRLHQQYPARELYFVHTSREVLNIREQHWVGIRKNYAASTER